MPKKLKLKDLNVKVNYFIIPLFTLAVAIIGERITASGMSWYKTINLPSWIPPNYIFGVVWTTIFILTAIAALIVWNKAPADHRRKEIMQIFAANGILNVLWTYIFFYQHLLGFAVIEAMLLFISVMLLIVLILPLGMKRNERLFQEAGALLAPYAVWVAFATYLTYSIWLMN
ncbi:tryptophan-rich sensory protein [Patescibacteria group bacterium]|nr:tryptophan-rich sensory protein [Patescibacteria group bacterium]MBU1034183.1 tryptophan-rich sensory protein [Patescibacteria group bacterium]MBU1629588.1 tryptophan-rich sensory protein [Patescibacteria group bacterium]MBU1907977.1 tryptophan-rich sensory protein [Patescibacteria group bacterium]